MNEYEAAVCVERDDAIVHVLQEPVIGPSDAGSMATRVSFLSAPADPILLFVAAIVSYEAAGFSTLTGLLAAAAVYQGAGRYFAERRAARKEGVARADQRARLIAVSNLVWGAEGLIRGGHWQGREWGKFEKLDPETALASLDHAADALVACWPKQSRYGIHSAAVRAAIWRADQRKREVGERYWGRYAPGLRIYRSDPKRGAWPDIEALAEAKEAGNDTSRPILELCKRLVETDARPAGSGHFEPSTPPLAGEAAMNAIYPAVLDAVIERAIDRAVARANGK